MSTKVLTKTQKVYNMLKGGKAVKLSTVAKRIYGEDSYTAQDNARRIINGLKSKMSVKLVGVGTYKVK